MAGQEFLKRGYRENSGDGQAQAEFRGGAHRGGSDGEAPENPGYVAEPQKLEGFATLPGILHAFLPQAVNCGRFCFSRRQSMVFLVVYEISWEPLNGFAPISEERRV